MKAVVIVVEDVEAVVTVKAVVIVEDVEAVVTVKAVVIVEDVCFISKSVSF